MIRFLRREIQEAGKCAEDVLALAREHGLPFYIAYATVFIGWSAATTGMPDAGIVQICEGIAGYRATGSECEVPWLVAALTEACAIAGRIDEGISRLDEMLMSTSRTGLRFFDSELNRLKGELLLKTSDSSSASQAESRFERAIEVARHQGARSLELRATTSLGRLWRRQGREKDAREILSAICGWFTEGFTTSDLKAARSVLDGDPAAPPQTPGGGLL